MGLQVRWMLLLATSLALGAGPRWLCAADPPDFAAQLQALAAKCEELGLDPQAKTTRSWRLVRHPGRQYLFLPFESEPTGGQGPNSDLIKFWRAKFNEYRHAQAVSRFAEAKQIAAAEPARAYRILFEVIREDPDHAAARRILEHEKNAAGKWVQRGAAKLDADVGRVDHPRLGWRARTYWKLDTPHFSIVTNHSAREAVEAGRQLEDLAALWRQVFFRYWTNGEALAARFAGGNEPLAPERPRMNVVLFATRPQYVAYLAPSQPKIDLTLGIYLGQQRTSYFYAGDTSVYPTWFHEGTHQLFQEAVPGVVESPGELRNFWALEGAALYMESLARHTSYWTAGGCEADRLQFARYRALSGEFLLPTERLAALGREQIQQSEDIRKIYAQAAGLAHFLIDGEGGKHREALVDLLTAVYRGNDETSTLARTTGLSYAQIDQAYRQFLDVTDDDLAGIPDPSRLRNLSLGHTSVSARALDEFTGCKKLEWLDLTNTPASGETLRAFLSSNDLKQLFLEGTKIDDDALALVARFRELEELDLSNLRISDAGLLSVGQMKSLKVLHLSGSPVSDAGLLLLRNLKQLESLETTGTKVTLAGLADLKKALPRLKP